jgi:DNA-binding NtrC family response regulator
MDEAQQVLLVAAQWRVRALLLAELQELGYEVVALPGLRWVVPALATRRAQPLAVVLDVTGDSHASPEGVAQVLELLGDTPAVLLVGTYQAAIYAHLEPRVARYMVRPVRVERIVEAVQELV